MKKPLLDYLNYLQQLLFIQSGKPHFNIKFLQGLLNFQFIFTKTYAYVLVKIIENFEAKFQFFDMHNYSRPKMLKNIFLFSYVFLSFLRDWNSVCRQKQEQQFFCIFKMAITFNNVLNNSYPLLFLTFERVHQLTR